MPERKGFRQLIIQSSYVKIIQQHGGCMKPRLLPMLAIGLLGAEMDVTLADDSTAEQKTGSTINEPPMKDTIKGTLMRKEVVYLIVQEDNNGGVQRIHVDKSTKLDKVMPGDRIKASMTKQGYATAVERSK